MKNYYDLLQCSMDATEEEIKRNYQRLVLECHPDRSTDKDKNDRFVEIDIAWKVLRDKASRDVYDAKLKMEQDLSPVLYGAFKPYELEWSDHGFFYTTCRCGGSYRINELQDGISYFINCDQCSLSICVED